MLRIEGSERKGNVSGRREVAGEKRERSGETKFNCERREYQRGGKGVKKSELMGYITRPFTYLKVMLLFVGYERVREMRSTE